MVDSDGGTCTNGACRVCTPGAARCNSDLANVAQSCDADGQWQDTQCGGGTPYCIVGNCSSAGCPNGNVDPGEQCDDNNQAVCDGCEACDKRRWLSVPVGAYASIPGLAAKMPTGNACYEVWARTAGVGDAIYFSSNTDSTHSNVLLRCSSGRVQFATENGGVNVTEPLLPCADGNWHHIAGCRTVSGSQATLTLFFDGQLVGTAAGSTANIAPAGPVHIGGVAYWQGGLGGAIDEVRISNLVRYASAFTPARRFDVDANTVALFHFDEGSGTTSTDSSSNQLVANLVGTSWDLDTGYEASMCQ